MRGYGKTYLQKQLRYLLIKYLKTEQLMVIYKYNKKYIHYYFYKIKLHFISKKIDKLFFKEKRCM